jgi:excisionase family DNA binding protein
MIETDTTKLVGTKAPVDRLTLTIEEAAIMLGVSRNAAYAAAKTGELPIIRIGKRKLVPRAALEKKLAVA